MGRHSKQPAPRRIKGSTLALAAVVPAGLFSVAATTPNFHFKFHHNAHDAVDPVADAHAANLHRSTTGPSEIRTAPASHPGGRHPAAPQPPRATTPPPPPPPPSPQAAEIARVTALPQGATPASLGIPQVAVDAYQAAAKTLAIREPGCHLPWTLIAGIGKVESDHGDNGNTDAHGTLLDPIYGPELNGSLANNEVIRSGGDYVRAEGPMQFLPATWDLYADPGADPQNMFDAALTTGKYLCSGGLDLSDVAQQATAVFRYNHSPAYVANVLAWAGGYATGLLPSRISLPAID